MTDPKALLDAALRAGDAQIDQIIAKERKLTALRSAMWRACRQLRVGRPEGALRTLQQALREDER